MSLEVLAETCIRTKLLLKWTKQLFCILEGPLFTGSNQPKQLRIAFENIDIIHLEVKKPSSLITHVVIMHISSHNIEVPCVVSIIKTKCSK